MANAARVRPYAAAMRTLATLLLAAGLAGGPAFAQGGFLGVSLEEPTADAVGAVIASVESRSAAAVMGLQAGDRIVGVDAVDVADPRALAATIGALPPGEIVELRVVRGGETLQLLGVLGRRPGMTRMPGAPAVPGVPGAPRPPAAPGAPDASDWNFEGFAMPVLPEMPAMPAMPEMPEMPNWEEFHWDDGAFRLAIPPMDAQDFDFEQFAPRMEELREQMRDLQSRHHDLMKDFHGQWREHGQQLRQHMPKVFVFPRDGADGQTRTRVQLRYPEATPEAERERLRAEAVEKYGPEVEIEFSGTGTSVVIERTMSRSGAAPSAPAAPASPTDDRREF